MLVNWLWNICFEAATDTSGSGDTTQGDTAPETDDKPDGDSADDTQAEFDRVAGKARKEGRKQGYDAALADLLKAAGFEDRDALISAATAAKERDEAEKTELQKAQEEVATLKQQIEDGKAAVAKLLADSRAKDLDSALQSELSEAKASKPADVLVLLKAHGLPDDLMDADGAIDKAAVKKAVDAYKKINPDYFRASGGGSTSNADATPSDLLAEAKKQAEAKINSIW